MTFSIVARCEKTGMLGIAITSSSICVASRCAWTRANVGVIATQNLTDPALGPIGLDLLTAGKSAQQTLDMLVAGDTHHAYRQLSVIDEHGYTAHHSGTLALPIVSSASGKNCIAAGNLLADKLIPEKMVHAFEETIEMPFPERLLTALEVGLSAGGEIRELFSAGLQVSHHTIWPEIDLRIDGQKSPLIALRELWNAYAPKLSGYVSRADNPQLTIV